MDDDDDSSRSTVSQMHGHSAMEACMLCNRDLSLDNASEEIDSIAMCGDCKFLFLEESSALAEETHRRRRTFRRRRTRSRSLESIDNLFSQQFSQLITMARNRDNHQMLMDEDDSTRFDTESDGFDSLYGESESSFSFNNLRLFPSESDVVSFSASDASFDEHISFVDIDPMNAALSQWDSYSEWEEAEFEENTVEYSEVESRAVNTLGSPLSIRINSNLDDRALNELFDQLADNNADFDFRRGAPPASESVLDSLPLIVIGNEHEGKNNELTCAICKEVLSIGTRANQLPCFHVYHPCCIVPWLSSRNSCPLCRYELPTDDKDYEEAKRDASSEIPVLDDEDAQIEDESVNMVCEKNQGSRNWFLLAAAPVVSLAGIALMIWFGKPQVSRRGGQNSS